MPVKPRRTTRRARHLRRAETEAEKRLWGFLRDRRFNDCKFIRQGPVGPYFADFLCREKRLIVEIDGMTHSEERAISYDARRTAHLEALGYRVLRVWNIDVFTNMDGVMESIFLALGSPSGTGR